MNAGLVNRPASGLRHDDAFRMPLLPGELELARRIVRGVERDQFAEHLREAYPARLAVAVTFGLVLLAISGLLVWITRWLP